jgi:hypothetical protein
MLSVPGQTDEVHDRAILSAVSILENPSSIRDVKASAVILSKRGS